MNKVWWGLPVLGACIVSMHVSRSPTSAPLGASIERKKVIQMRGKCSWFGGPSDRGIGKRETTSIYPNKLARNLNHLGAHYIAVRFRKSQIDSMVSWEIEAYTKAVSETSLDKRKFTLSRDYQILIINPSTGKSVRCWIVDWGPSSKTERVFDLSLRAMRDLGAKTDDVLIGFFIPAQDRYDEPPLFL